MTLFPDFAAYQYEITTKNLSSISIPDDFALGRSDFLADIQFEAELEAEILLDFTDDKNETALGLVIYPKEQTITLRSDYRRVS